MPSAENTPGIPELMKAFRGEIAARDSDADLHTGSSYDIWGGVAAVLLTREGRRARDIFRSNYFDYAHGADLNEILTERFRNARIVDGPGDGAAFLSRTSTSAGAGTIWQGTRIEAAIPNGAMRTYLVASDVTVGATTKEILVPLVSVAIGDEATIDAEPSAALALRIPDPLWDNSWTIQRLTCAPGTIGETEEEAKARIRQLRLDARVGYPKRIVDVCKAAGATNVVLFGSDYLDTPPGQNAIIGSLSDGYGDVGLNRVFVSDASYTASHSLLVKCRYAMASNAVLGTSLQVWGMTPVAFSCTIAVQLWDDPSVFDQDSIREEIANAVADYFDTGSNAFYFRYSSLQGAIMRSVRSIQTVTFSSGPAEPSLFTFLNTAALSRYTSSPGALNISLSGP